MTDAATEPVLPQRRLVFTTRLDDALALERRLKPANRGWRLLLGYLMALPLLLAVTVATQDAETPVWYIAFGVAGGIAWGGSRLVLKLEREQAARRHLVGASAIEVDSNGLRGTIGATSVDVPATTIVRVETDDDHVHIIGQGRPALILPLAAFADKADMVAFATVVTAATGRT